MDQSARDLNRAVSAARNHLVSALMPKIAEVDLDSARVAVTFEGNLFDSGDVT
jgi:hypothetical protein